MNEDEQFDNLQVESPDQHPASTDPQSDLVKGPDDLSRTDIVEIYNAAEIGISFVHDPRATPEQQLKWCEQVFIGIQAKLSAGNPSSRPVIASSCVNCKSYPFGSVAWSNCVKNYC